MVCILRCLARLEDCKSGQLLANFHEANGGSYIREALSATREWALMRLVTSMSTAVDSQGAALNEGLVARFVVTSVGTFIGMYSVMTLEIRFSIETLCDAVAVSVWSQGWVDRRALTTPRVGRRMIYLWTPLMPFALKRTGSHIGSVNSTFTS